MCVYLCNTKILEWGIGGIEEVDLAFKIFSF